MQQTLLQFINVVHPRLIDSLLDDAPYIFCRPSWQGWGQDCSVATDLMEQALPAWQVVQCQICQNSNFWILHGSVATYWKYGGCIIWVLLEFQFSFQQQKNFENPLRIDKVIDMSLVYYFFGTQCTRQNKVLLT